jgi:hypothetical protein
MLNKLIQLVGYFIIFQMFFVSLIFFGAGKMDSYYRNHFYYTIISLAFISFILFKKKNQD